jgi:hypothetical protein
MRHRLYLKFLSLIAVKGLVIGHAQWTGALTIPSQFSGPLAAQWSSSGADRNDSSFNPFPAKHPPVLKSRLPPDL